MAKMVPTVVFSWGSFIAVLFVMAAISFTSPPVGDASVFGYVGKGILAGEIPYLDRWDHKGPAIYVIYAIGLTLPGWWGIWLINLAFLTGLTWIAFKLVHNVFGTTPALFAVATLLIYVRLLGEGQGYTEYYALLPQFLALFLVFRADGKDGPDAWTCIAIGILGGFSFLLRANLIGIWLALGIYWIIRWREARLSIAWATLGGLSLLSAVSIAFVSLGAWSELWDSTVWFNLIYSETSVWFRIRAALLMVWHLSPVAPLLVIAWCLGVWYWVAGRSRSEMFGHIWPFVLIAGPVEVVLSMLSGRGIGHYYLALLPIGTLYLGFITWFICRKRLITPAFLTLVLLFVTLNYHMDIYASGADLVRKFKSGPPDAATIVPSISRNDTDLKVADAITRNSHPTDTILVWGESPQIYLLSERAAPTRFFHPAPLFRPGYTRSNDLDEFTADVVNGRPAVIIEDTRNDLWPPLDETRRSMWLPNERYLFRPDTIQKIFAIVESDYELVEEVDGYRIYVRIRQV